MLSIPVFRKKGIIVDIGDNIVRSLRFNAPDSTFLSRTPGAASNRQIFTHSYWFKRSALPTGQVWLAQIGATASDTDSLYFGFFNDQLQFGGGTTTWRLSSQVFRDVTGWSNIVLAVDTTQAVAADRIKIYHNGVEITAFATNVAPGLSANMAWNNNVVHNVGRTVSNTQYISGYMAQFEAIDGQRLLPTAFGRFSAQTGAWVNKNYSGTYGTNGFQLKFADNSSTANLGLDTSGNGNTWTTSGFSVTAGVGNDSMIDTPTDGYSVISNIAKKSTITVANGGLDVSNSSASISCTYGTMSIPATGKWYAEFTMTGGGHVGITDSVADAQQFLQCGSPRGVGYRGDGQFTKDGANIGATSSYTTGDVVSCAFDSASGKIWFAKNGTYLGSGNPAGGTNQVAIATAPLGFYVFSGDTYNVYSFVANFGQRPFAFTPPTGFVALSTANLPVPVILNPAKDMAVNIRTGTGAVASVTGIGFQPDLVWTKSRSAVSAHSLYDSVRGVQNQLEPNTTNMESVQATGLTAFNADGFTLGALAQMNTNAATYVDWMWKKGVVPGMDVVLYAGTGGNRTVAHGLGAVPAVMICKNRSINGNQWALYHKDMAATPQSGSVYLNRADAFAADSAIWNNTAPTSTLFSLGASTNVNGAGSNYVAWLFAEVPGFSKIGTYIGNGNADGMVLNCGFKPAWVMIKSASAGGLSWAILDTKRNPFNVANLRLFADTTAADNVQNELDFLATGFKLRTVNTNENQSGVTFIFIAFAEIPDKYARAG